jgi:hypothetical protein
MIERDSKIKMKMKNPPSAAEIIEASSKDMMDSFQNVNQNILSNYEKMAEELLELYPPKEALTRAMALISKHETGFKSKSLITGQKDTITFEILGHFENMNTSLFSFFKLFDDYPDIKNEKPFKNLKKISFNKGFVFDIEEKYFEKFDEIAKDIESEGYSMRVCESLPDLEQFNRNREYSRDFDDRRDDRNNNRNFGDRRDGGYRERFGDRREGGSRDRFNDRREGGFRGRFDDRREGGFRDRFDDRRERYFMKMYEIGQNSVHKKLTSNIVRNTQSVKMLPLHMKPFMRSKHFSLGLFSLAGIYHYFQN